MGIGQLVDDMLMRLDKIDPENILDSNDFGDYGLEYDDHDPQSIHPDDIELLDLEEDFEGTPDVLRKSIREILSMRYKRKTRLYLLTNMKRNELNIDAKKKINITVLDLVLFNRKYEWFPNVGIYGKWRMRRDPSAFLKEMSLVERIKILKQKKWALNRFKNRSEVGFKKDKFTKVIDNKLTGKTIDLEGKLKRK